MPSALAEALAWIALPLLVESSVVLALGLLIGLAVRHRPALRTLVHRAALVGMVALAVVPATPLLGVLDDWRDWTAALRARAPASEGTPAPAAQPPPPPALTQPPVPSDAPGQASATLATEPARIDAAPRPSERGGARWRPPPWLYRTVASIWLAGAALLLLWLLACLLGLLLLRREGESIEDARLEAAAAEISAALRVRPPRLLACRRLQSACVAGPLRPAILLPASYADEFDLESMRGVLAHEIAHLQRRDPHWALLIRIVCAICWVQPLLWLLRRQMADAAENACDLAAIALGCRPQIYASALVALAERLTRGPERVLDTAVAPARSALSRRVEAILRVAQPRRETVSAVSRGGVALGTLLLVATLVRAQPQPPAPLTQRRVTLAAGATMPQVIAELAVAIDGVVVADVTTVSHTVQRPLKDAPLLEALAAISADFDCYWVRRGPMLALQARRSDPAEPWPLELEEMIASAADVEAIIASVDAVPLRDLGAAAAAFAASLTAEQSRRMMSDGLRFGELTGGQQQLLLSTCMGHAVAETAQDAMKAPGVLRQLPRSQVGALTPGARPRRAGDPEAGRRIRLTAPGATEAGTLRVDLYVPSSRALQLAIDESAMRLAAGPNARRPLWTNPLEPRASHIDDSPPIWEGEALPAPPPRAGLVWRAEPQLMTLAQFTAAWESGTGAALETPAYASGRQFWICSVGATRVEALTALADLWGWESRAIPGGRRLARVIPRTPPLPAELGASIRRALPPAVRHEARFTYVWMERRQPGRGLRALFDQLTRAEGVDSTIPLADLPAETQRILVAIVLMNVAQPWVANPTVEQRDPKGLPHLAEPRAIVLRGGPPSGEAPGMIRIAAPLDPSSPEAWPELGWRAFTIPWGGLAFYTEVPQPDGSTRFEKSEVPESVRDEMRERMAHYAP